MNAQPTIIHIALQQLALSPRNARKTNGASVEDLAASIAAHGLLQNLTVQPSANGDSYGVVAGGRRLAALHLLAERGALPADHPLCVDGIPCRVIHDDAVAIEASTAENTLREAMHPADQFDAFKAMLDAGKPLPDVAAHFGVTERVVTQRLKLANVAPELVQVYRDGDMDLEQLQALAITDDHEAQRAAWFTPKYEYERSAYRLRQALTHADVGANSAVARFVGVEHYVAAGGALRSDLFSDRDDAWLTDSTLLDTLAREKLQFIARREEEDGWSWVEVHPSLDYAQLQEFPRLPEPDGEDGFATPDDAERYAELRKRHDTLEDMDEDTFENDEGLQQEYGEIEDELQAIEDRKVRDWPAEAKAVAGVLVFLDSDGLRIERGRLRPGQKLGAAGTVTGKAKATKGETAAKPKKPELSADMLTRLDLHRAAACRQLLAEQPALAVQLLTAQLVEDLFFSGTASVFDLRSTNAHRTTSFGVGPGGDKFPDVRKADARAVLGDSIKDVITPKKRAEVLPWIQTLDATQLQQVQALCAAVSLKNLRDRNLQGLANTLGCDMAQWWQPDADRYLAHVSKTLILEAVAEAQGKDAAAALANLKKDALIAEAGKQLAGTGWLPKPLRGPGYALKGAADPTPAKPAAKGKPKAARKPAKKAAAKKPAKKKAPAKA